MSKTVLFYFLVLIVFVVLALIAKNANIEFTDMPVDYGNYIRGIQMLYDGQNPYQSLEFFEPPWIAFILSPFYLLQDALFWQIACLLFLILVMIITYRQFKPTPANLTFVTGLISSFFLPTTIFALTLGQFAPLVGWVTVWLYMRLNSGKLQGLEVIFGLILITLKVHVVFLPIVIFCLELIRRRNWTILLVSGMTVVLLGFLSSIFLLENWFSPLMQSILVDQKFIGGDGLAGGRHFSYANLGISNVVFVPLMIYVFVLWIKNGISQYLLLLSLAANFMLVPYSRQYDYVLLLPAWFYILSKWIPERNYLRAIVVFMLLFFFPFYGTLHFFIPTIIFTILLLLPPSDNEIKSDPA